MPKKFTNNMQPPVGIGAKIGLQSPILASYAATQDTTKGVVVEYVTNDDDQLDNCTVLFRGKLIKATCCHPGIEVNMAVSIIEQPIGCFWATVLQRSWYSRQLSELTDKGHPFQAAAEYLLKDQPKWQPQIILIDKRGVEPGPPTPPTPPAPFPPEENPFPWSDDSGLPFVFTDPETGSPYTFDDFDTNNDGRISINEWPFDSYLFGFADTNRDGFISAGEWAAFWQFWSDGPTVISSDRITIVGNPGTGGVVHYNGASPTAEADAWAIVNGWKATVAAEVLTLNAENGVFYYRLGSLTSWRPLQYASVETGPTVEPAEPPPGWLVIIYSGQARCVLVGLTEPYFPA